MTVTMQIFRTGFRRMRTLAAVAGFVILPACSSLIDTNVPASTDDPTAYNNAEGAIERYRGLLSRFRDATSGLPNVQSFIGASGLLSDELTTGIQTPPSSVSLTGSAQAMIDARILPDPIDDNSTIDGPWTALHAVRISAMDAIGALHKYAPLSPKDRIGHAYALWGMAEVMLADLYCSGIPLSTIAFEGEITRAHGSTSQTVYEHALTLFDSALVYAVDSTQYRDLARIGKGWVLLDLDRYDEAAAAVHDVLTSFKYQNPHVIAANGEGANFTYFQPGYPSQGAGSVSDREGGNGMPFLSDQDPRIPFDTLPPDQNSFSGTFVGYAFLPYVTPEPGAGAVTIASGIEARLIEAEAELKAGDASWLTTLNDLRTSCTSAASCPTLAPAGTGGVAGLPLLSNPVTPDARIDMLFKERAFWLYLTGRRLGDLRRLVRQYGRNVDAVFPAGPKIDSPNGAYGTYVNLPAPYAERRDNTNYTGCINRDA
jgi:hypothetical protein